jgi:aspartate aminotransferase
VMLSDEIYGEIHHEGAHVSIAEFYPEGTIISTGLSKWCGAGGWRLGTFTFPDSLHWLLKSMAVVASETFTATSAPIQHAAVTAFHVEPAISEYLVHCRRILRALGRRLARELRAAGAAVADPEGAFYLFPDFEPLRESLRARGIVTNTDLCNRLLQDTGVATIPGSSCGQPDAELALRLAYVDFDGAATLDASLALGLEREIDDAFLEEHCPRVIEAVDRMGEWVRR